mgnify:CR=1 FL=1
MVANLLLTLIKEGLCVDLRAAALPDLLKEVNVLIELSDAEIDAVLSVRYQTPIASTPETTPAIIRKLSAVGALLLIIDRNPGSAPRTRSGRFCQCRRRNPAASSPPSSRLSMWPIIVSVTRIAAERRHGSLQSCRQTTVETAGGERKWVAGHEGGTGHGGDAGGADIGHLGQSARAVRAAIAVSA